MTETPPKTDWGRFLSEDTVSLTRLCSEMPVSPEEISRVVRTYPMRISPYFFSLIRQPGDPIYRQVIPSEAELSEEGCPSDDPLAEAVQSPVPHLVHRYPDRALFLISSQCAVYCRHCMRKRAVGTDDYIDRSSIEMGLEYISDTPAIREVLLSGGDPLMIGDDRLEWILSRLKRIKHVDLLRIHTRIPCVLPHRITDRLAALLGGFHPLYVNIQFNHPSELTEEVGSACAKLADAGIPLGSQTVLLKGVNDRADVMIDLMRRLLAIRVRPYYLHHPDPVRGTSHFRVPVEHGLSIMEDIRGNISGMGIPQYVIDLPEGGGKVPLLPEYVVRRNPDNLIVRNFEGRRFIYPLA